MAIFNPIVLIIANFVLFATLPAIGKHTMPIALNVAFFIFFALSLVFAIKAHKTAGARATIIGNIASEEPG